MSAPQNQACPHCKEIMVRIEGVYALIKVTKENEKVTFFPGMGVPVVVYGCVRCNGLLQLYPAKSLGEI